ncbi:MAG: altronate dehydratase [Armatimonadetes bacterium]|nr:altronate dehydratase [Armatimonadota bacterium]
MSRLLRLHPDDHVAVAREDLAAGSECDGVSARADIPRGHKIALTTVAEGQPVRKYGQVIGFASAAIEPGDWVHTHNLGFGAGELGLDYAAGADLRPFEVLPPEQRASFLGYRRSDGRVGTRNYLAVVSTVNCSAAVCTAVARAFEGCEAGLDDFDGVIPLTTKGGCAVKPGYELELFQRTLAGFANHPNVGAYVVVGLGCEGNRMADFLHTGGLIRLEAAPERRPPTFFMQELGGTQRTIEAASRAVAELIPRVANARRTPESAEHLRVGLQCGGSDALSGITANPAVGAMADLLVRHGGTPVLGETPEIYGAEHLLIRRATSQAVADRLLARIAWWKDYTARNGFSIDNNPAPGNKDGGLTTIFEKSMGAVAKAGTSPLVDVLEYAQPVTQHGLVHMDTPGYDPVSATGQVAGGCQLVVFTTGRGSCFGFKPAPSLKVATNTPMYELMKPDMDLNAGTIMDGTATVESVGAELFDRLLRLASGERSVSEAMGLGLEEFNPWIIGCTM